MPHTSPDLSAPSLQPDTTSVAADPGAAAATGPELLPTPQFLRSTPSTRPSSSTYVAMTRSTSRTVVTKAKRPAADTTKPAPLAECPRQATAVDSQAAAWRPLPSKNHNHTNENEHTLLRALTSASQESFRACNWRAQAQQNLTTLTSGHRRPSIASCVDWRLLRGRMLYSARTSARLRTLSERQRVGWHLL